MRTSILAGTLLASLALFGSSLAAQEVSAEVAVRGGPVAGHVIVRDEYSDYRRHEYGPGRRVIVTKRHVPRVIVVERVRHHHRKHWKRGAYRPVVIYYFDGRYYDWLDRRHPRVREVVVYEHHGRYYRDDRSYDRDD
jgi:hypothetical protein